MRGLGRDVNLPDRVKLFIGPNISLVADSQCGGH